MPDWSFMSDFAAGVTVAGSTACIEVLLRLRGMHKHKRTVIAALAYLAMAVAHSTLRASGFAAFQTWALEGAIFVFVGALILGREIQMRRARVAEVVAQIEAYKAEWEARRAVSRFSPTDPPPVSPISPNAATSDDEPGNAGKSGDEPIAK